VTGRRFTDLSNPAWEQLFQDVRSSWFRLETLPAYDVQYEAEEFATFQATGAIDPTPGPWQQMISDHVAHGRRLQRVHVVREPLSDYLRYELAVYARNAEAGEEIRLLPVTGDDWPQRVPERGDYWLFDDERLWTMRDDSAGRFVAAEEVPEPPAVESARSLRDWSLDHSHPLADYRLRAA
jgi:hypothetical protein